MKNRRILLGLLIATWLLFGGLGIAHRPSEGVTQNTLLTKDTLSEMLGDSSIKNQEFPTETEIMVGETLVQAQVQYTFDVNLQATMEHLFQTYRPDFGVFVAIDPTTGQVLSMVSYSHPSKHLKENLALRATFPAASIFKVVTAAAAIAERNFSASTVVPFNGRNHTLYRSNVLKNYETRWTRHMTLKDAFAKSVNTVFGKIGVFELGAHQLQVYADRFGFNRKIASDIPFQEGKAIIPQDAFELAESASGFTKETTMSPLQGALIAASIFNNGIMMEPFVVQSVYTKEGHLVYQAQPNVAHLSVDGPTSAEMRSLMRATIRQGTSKKAFRGFFNGKMSELDVGGKTGSLTGRDPKGKYDWFIGFAHQGRRPIAISVLTVNEKLWKVKSSILARKALERYYSNQNNKK